MFVCYVLACLCLMELPGSAVNRSSASDGTLPVAPFRSPLLVWRHPSATDASRSTRPESGASQNPLDASESVALVPHQTRVLTTEQRADIELARKEYAEAIQGYRRALAGRGSNDAYLWNKLGIACQMDQDYDAAGKAYRKAIRAKPDFPEPWNNLGTTYYLQNKLGK